MTKISSDINVVLELIICLKIDLFLDLYFRSLNFHRFGIASVERLYREVAGTAEKIEELSEKRRAKLKDIARVKALELETEQVCVIGIIPILQKIFA